jgi:FkbM family methyltransferase
MIKLDQLRDALARRLQSPQARLRDPDTRRRLLLQRHAIDLVLDVGANEGQYAQALRERSEYTGRVVSFEPVPAAYGVLAQRAERDPAWACERIALSDRQGHGVINVGPVSVLSSMLPARASLDGTELATRGHGTTTVPLARLDDAARPHLREGDHVLLKVDVQGYEPQVLKGAQETLSVVELIECECSIVALYEGQRSFRQLIDQLDDLGFSPVSVQPNMIESSSGYVVDADLVFVRGAINPFGQSPP